MLEPIKLEIFKEGTLFEEIFPESVDELYFPIEMMTGVGWLDTEPLYQALLLTKRKHITDTFLVCHSFEKWGGMEQEVVKIKVRIHRID